MSSRQAFRSRYSLSYQVLLLKVFTRKNLRQTCQPTELPLLLLLLLPAQDLFPIFPQLPGLRHLIIQLPGLDFILIFQLLLGPIFQLLQEPIFHLQWPIFRLPQGPIFHFLQGPIFRLLQGPIFHLQGPIFHLQGLNFKLLLGPTLLIFHLPGPTLLIFYLLGPTLLIFHLLGPILLISPLFPELKCPIFRLPESRSLIFPLGVTFLLLLVQVTFQLPGLKSQFQGLSHRERELKALPMSLITQRPHPR